MEDYIRCDDRRKYRKEASDNKSEESRPPLKLDFNGGQFSSFLFSEASFIYFGRSRLEDSGMV